MLTTHKLTTHGRCPVDVTVIDYYEVTFETTKLVKIEDIRDAVATYRDAVTYQERLTQDLARDTGCRVTTTGLHGTVETVCVVEAPNASV